MFEEYKQCLLCCLPTALQAPHMSGAGRGAGAGPPPQGVAWPQLGPGTPGLTQVGQRFWVWRSR